MASKHINLHTYDCLFKQACLQKSRLEDETVVGAGAKKKIKAAPQPTKKQPDVEEGGVPGNAKQNDVFYKV